MNKTKENNQFDKALVSLSFWTLDWTFCSNQWPLAYFLLNFNEIHLFLLYSHVTKVKCIVRISDIKTFIIPL